MTITNNLNNSFAGSLSVNKTNIGSTTNITISNSDNSDATSHSYLKMESGGASGGDAQVTLYNSVAYTSLGIDNSDSDALVVSRSNALGTSNYARCDTTGNWTYPSSAVFCVTGDGTQQFNVIGDAGSSVYTVPYGVSVYDVGSNFSSVTNAYTIPISGIYYFSGQCSFNGFSNLGWIFTQIFKNGSPALSYEFGIHYYGSPTYYAVPCSGLIKCDAGDTLDVRITAYDLAGKVGDTHLYSDSCWFTGVLLA